MHSSFGALSRGCLAVCWPVSEQYLRSDAVSPGRLDATSRHQDMRCPVQDGVEGLPRWTRECEEQAQGATSSGAGSERLTCRASPRALTRGPNRGTRAAEEEDLVLASDDWGRFTTTGFAGLLLLPIALDCSNVES